MTATHASSIIDGYLKRLDGELSDLPTGRRKEVSGQIAEHIAEARSQLTDETDADLLTILDRLGEPDEIAAEARSRFDLPADRPGLIEILALMLLAAGPLVLPFPPVAWLLAAALVWRSRTWSQQTKYHAVYLPLVVVLALVLIAALSDGLFSGHLLMVPFVFAIVAGTLVPIGSAIYLGFRLRGRMPMLGWIAILIVCVAVYVPAGSLFAPPTASAFIGTPVGEPARPDCGGFYGTLEFSSHTPMAARVPISVGICWDGQQVTKEWGPDCFPSYGPGEILSVESCTVTSVADGSLEIQVQATERPLTSMIGIVSHAALWRITADGHIVQIA